MDVVHVSLGPCDVHQSVTGDARLPDIGRAVTLGTRHWVDLGIGHDRVPYFSVSRARGLARDGLEVLAEDQYSGGALLARTGGPVVLLLGVAPCATAENVPQLVRSALCPRDDVVSGGSKMFVIWVEVLPAVMTCTHFDESRKLLSLNNFRDFT
jgi:hypothetical protein